MNHIASLETTETLERKTNPPRYIKGLSLLAETDSKADVQQYPDSSHDSLLTCQNIQLFSDNNRSVLKKSRKCSKEVRVNIQSESTA